MRQGQHTFSQRNLRVWKALRRSWRKPSLILLLALVPIVGLSASAQAADFRSGNTSNVPSGQTVDGTLFISGRTIDIAGTVNGDVFCAGQNITISGEISGDVICAGQTVRVSGRVDGDIRIAGQTLTIGGTVARNVTAAGQSVTADANSQLQGDVSLAGQDTSINGQVGRDLSVGSENVYVNGQVGRDIQAGVTNMRLGGNAVVGGDIRYTSSNRLQRDAGAQVSGAITQTQPKQADKDKGSAASLFWWALWLIVSMLLLSLALVLLLPRLFQRATNDAMGHLLRTFLIGLIASFVVPVIIFILFATIIGIPLAILALLVWLAILIASGPFAAYLLGRYLMRGHSSNAVTIMLVGGLVLLVIYLVPILGWIVMTLAHWFGLGIILTQLLRIPKPRYSVDGAGSQPHHVAHPSLPSNPRDNKTHR